MISGELLKPREPPEQPGAHGSLWPEGCHGLELEHTGSGWNPGCPLHTCGHKTIFTLRVLLGPSTNANPTLLGQLVLIEAAPLASVTKEAELRGRRILTVGEGLSQPRGMEMGDLRAKHRHCAQRQTHHHSPLRVSSLSFQTLPGPGRAGTCSGG